jgi:hypothetical protein
MGKGLVAEIIALRRRLAGAEAEVGRLRQELAPLGPC